MKPVKERQRRHWDIFVFAIIVVATFEIPYDLFVGHVNKSTETYFNWLFYLVFGVDIVLNLFTEQRVYDAENNEFRMTETLVESRKRYLFSVWFLVDLLAIFPFDLVFSGFGILNISRTLRLSRIPRLLRLFRAMRGVKGIHLLNKLAQAWSMNPSYARFVAIFILIPWIAHVLACLFYFYEPDQYESYLEALGAIFLAFIDTTAPEFSTLNGKIIAYLAVLFGYLFFGAFIGNFATMFEKFDEQRSDIISVYQQWNSIFKRYPSVYDAALRKQILEASKQMLEYEEKENEESLISNLPFELEQEVRKRLNNQLKS